MEIIEKDPVCGMDAKGSKIHSDYENKKVNFCSEGCKLEFEKDPKKYMKK